MLPRGRSNDACDCGLLQGEADITRSSPIQKRDMHFHGSAQLDRAFTPSMPAAVRKQYSDHQAHNTAEGLPVKPGRGCRRRGEKGILCHNQSYNGNCCVRENQGRFKNENEIVRRAFMRRIRENSLKQK